MSDNFTASNGVIIGKLHEPLRWAVNPLVKTLHLEPDDMIALREFFQAEIDERLGGWRLPENPDYVVYDEHPDLVCVVNERDGQTITAHRADARTFEPRVNRGHYKAAWGYFDAHPKPTPAWHDAQPGDVWVLTVEGRDVPAIRDVDEDFVSADPHCRVIRCNSDSITAGRRIWPPEES